MFSRILKRVNYANVAATLAVLFAMTGGALAASKYVITSTKQIKPSVLAQIKGKNGAPGKDGAPGAQGPAGLAGAQGTKGANGSNGVNGSNGTDGKAGTTGPKGTTGANGVTGASGATGPTGQSGFTEVLPSGKTETGVWSASRKNLIEEEIISIPVSFPIPLSSASPKAFIFNHADTAAENFGTSGCAGTLTKPTAPKGVLCIYTGPEFLHETEVRPIHGIDGTAGYGTSGAILEFKAEANSGIAEASGTWAVTAP
jgi:hypothetical protein